jgi:hypothetical protein
MPRVGFEPTIPVLERTKTVYALDRAAIVIYSFSSSKVNSSSYCIRELIIQLLRSRCLDTLYKLFDSHPVPVWLRYELRTEIL